MSLAAPDIVVVGASAGGVGALCSIVQALPADFPAAVFVVLHLSPHSHSVLPAILARHGLLPACHPDVDEKIEAGRIYVAIPDRHLSVAEGRIRLSRNASENGFRPAVDVLFRTAAHAFGPRVIGVVLTGNLDDGTSGLAAIKRCGGLAVVQDPLTADYPGMPGNAIANVEVDHVVPLGEIGPLLNRLVREPRPADRPEGCDDIEKEPDLMGIDDRDTGGQGPSGEPSGFTCPECGGALYERPGEKPLHFRCRTGHAYSPESLLAQQTESLEATLWAALRSLEENAALSRRMSRRARERGNSLSSDRYEQRAAATERHAGLLRTLLKSGMEEAD